MIKWLKRVFCRHKKSVIVGDYIESIKDNHYQRKYLHKCCSCGKEW